MSDVGIVGKTETATESLKPTLGLFSAMTLVAGSMIGSGIFIVSADIARQLPSPGLLILIWCFTGLVTLLGAIAYGKLAAHMPRAGGQYVFLKEAWGETPAFLYGWALFTVIQTGTVAAVAVAFAKYLGVLVPAISSQVLLPLTPTFGISAQQLVAVAILLGLTAFNCTGVKNGALLQNLFTSLKVLALLSLIGIGFSAGNLLFTGAVDWNLSLPADFKPGDSLWALFAMATVGALFSSDAWNNVTFIGEEIENPRRNLPLALTLGTGIVVLLYILVNFAYLNLLPLELIQHAPEDRVATVAMQSMFGNTGAFLMAGIILISTFGCLNGLILAGARVFYAMAKDGLLFSQWGKLHPKTLTPNVSLWAQGIWSCLLALSGQYGQLLDFVIFTTLLFYMLTLVGLMKLGRKDPEALQMRTWLDTAIPVLYLVGVAYVAFFLLIGPDKWFTSLMGLGLTAIGLPVYGLWKKTSQH